MQQKVVQKLGFLARDPAHPGLNVHRLKRTDGKGAQDYHADSDGVELNFRVMSNTCLRFRKGQAVPDDWNEEIKKDYERRGGKR